MQTKCIQIEEKQEEFIQNQSKRFNLSKFVRGKLDEYIKMVKQNGETRPE